jgi:transcriptional antiterminator NusG
MEVTKDTKAKWYMVKCVTGKEEKAIINLKSEIELSGLGDYIDDIICPKEKQFFMRNKKKVTRNKIMFPGYILLKAQLTGEVPRLIKNTNYVAQIMGNSNGPEAITDKEVERILNNVEKAKVEVEFIEGETIKISDGPFKGFEAVIQDINRDKEKVTVEVMIFGTPRPMELNYIEIERIK